MTGAGTTELEQHQESVHKSVQDDIRLVILNLGHALRTSDRCERLSARRRMLSSSAAYKKHVSPKAISRGSLTSLSIPKAQRMHPENNCQQLDPMEYARMKARALQEQREHNEAGRGRMVVEQQKKSKELATYRELKEKVTRCR